MTFDRSEYAEDQALELGYAVVGEREVRLREWQDTRRDPEFDQLVRKLRHRKYGIQRVQRARTDAEYRAWLRAFSKRWAKTEAGRTSHKAAIRAYQIRKRAARRAEVITCADSDCGATFCSIRAGGRKPRFCSEACAWRTRWREKNPGRPPGRPRTRRGRSKRNRREGEAQPMSEAA